MLAGIGAFVSLDWSRVSLWLAALAISALAFGALGVSIGALAREVRAASLLAFLLSLPLAFLALVPSGSVGRGLYDAVSAVSFVFPFKASLEALDAAVNQSSPGLLDLACAPRRAGGAVRRARAGGPAAPGLTRGYPWGRMAFPQTRMRRLRSSASLRGLVRETELRAGQLVLPLFVTDGDPTHPGGDGSPPTREPIATDQDPAHPFERLSISALLDEAHAVAALGIAGVMLFGIPAAKDAEGSGAWDEEGVIQTAVRALKQRVAGAARVSPMCASASTPTTATAAFCGKAPDRSRRPIRRPSTTTRRSSCSLASRSAMPAPVPISWLHRT